MLTLVLYLWVQYLDRDRPAANDNRSSFSRPTAGSGNRHPGRRGVHIARRRGCCRGPCGDYGVGHARGRDGETVRSESGGAVAEVTLIPWSYLLWK